MLALLCHVHPRAQTLARVLNDRHLSFRGTALQAVALSFEEIISRADPALDAALALELSGAMPAGAAPSLWIAVSPSAAVELVQRCAALSAGAGRQVRHLICLGMGPGTAEVLADAQQQGLPIDLSPLSLALEQVAPGEPDSDRVPVVLAQQSAHWKRHSTIQVIKGDKGRTEWLDALRAQSFVVHDWAAYSRRLSPPDADQLLSLRDAVKRSPVLASVLPSASAIDALVRWLPQDLRAPIFARPCLVPHPRLVPLAKAAGFLHAAIYVAGTQGLLDALKSASEHN